ncbi:uncharacterized protein PG986_015121 [Apiospora aurea]|uniref:Uncharacterized protein n=1 Tax=Apiospora aurea TaxID=335848 RepID=A0ABR1PSP1_9PEZI
MSFSILKSAPRVGSRAIQAAITRPVLVQQRSTSWMGFEQPNPSAYNPPPSQPPQEGGEMEKETKKLLRQQATAAVPSATGEPSSKPPPNNKVPSVLGKVVKHEGFVDWLTQYLAKAKAKKQQQKKAKEAEALNAACRQQQAAEAEAVRVLVRQRPYYELQTLKLRIPGCPATYGCAPEALHDPAFDTDPVEGCGPVRKWRYDYYTERRITELAQEAAERSRLAAKKREIKSQYREALRKALREEQAKPHD